MIVRAENIANYVNACIILESSDGTPSDVRIIEQHFRSAIDRAKLARTTAEGIQFTLGVNSAESRLTSLLEMPTVPVGTASQ